MEQKLLKIGSFVAGAIFLISGIGKMLNTLNFAMLITNYGLGYLFFLSPIIVVAEIIIGMFLIFNFRLRITALIAAILTTIFTFAFIYAKLTRGIEDCGCFGVIKSLNLSPTITILRNIFIIILTGVIAVKFRESKNDLKKWQTLMIYFVVGISIFVAGFTFSPPSADSRPKQHPFHHMAVKDTEIKDVLRTNKDSSYLLFYFSYDCAHCWNSIENLKPYVKGKVVDTVILFGNGDDKEKQFFNQLFEVSFAINYLPKDSITSFVYYYPTAFFIRNDTVENVIQSELPAAATYNKYFLKK